MKPILVLAPMQGLTEVLFRKTYYGLFPEAFDYAVSPFLSLTHGNLSDASTKIDDVLPANNIDSIPVIPQILGKEPAEFVALANRLYDVGFHEVNWNIGCPVRRVAGKHRGSGILPYPDEVRQVLEQVVPHIKSELTIKMRLGFRSSDEILNLIPILNAFPIKNVTIHPRIGKQMYGGVPDLDMFEKVYHLIDHRVIYNGDINTVEQYRYLSTRFPDIDEFMIGRGVLYDPLLPMRIKGLSCDEKLAFQFVGSLKDAILELPIRDEAKIRKIKEYWCLCYKSLRVTEQQRNQVLHCQSLAETESTLEVFLQ